MAKVNPLRGQSSVTIDGEEIVLEANFDNMAAFQRAVGVEGLGPLMRLVGGVDARALMAGLECLAVSGDVAKARQAPFMKHMSAVQEAILEAFGAGIEKAPEGNVPGETTEAA